MSYEEAKIKEKHITHVGLLAQTLLTGSAAILIITILYKLKWL